MGIRSNILRLRESSLIVIKSNLGHSINSRLGLWGILEAKVMPIQTTRLQIGFRSQPITQIITRLSTRYRVLVWIRVIKITFPESPNLILEIIQIIKLYG